eukprot:NODE_62_length_26495_cov_0.832853.p14 type:complete len:204 gc:universal NODE_62_length_26495_cov_0.832853:8891-9502(+)
MQLYLSLLFALSYEEASKASKFAKFQITSRPNWVDDVIPKILGCTSYQEDVISYAWGQSLVLKARAVGYLIKYGPKIDEYFGGSEFDYDISIKALSTYSKSFVTPFNITCSSELASTSFGMVDESAKNIVLGISFFDLKSEGFNSQPGAIVNLETQFLAVGGAVYRGLNVSDAKALAVENPALALASSENYQFFSESVTFDLE